MRERPERITRTKRLTLDNWLERDETLDAFVCLSPEGISPLATEALARRFLSVELSSRVPGEVQVLFRTAQAVILYGHFFYPLFALGQEQLTRVAEAALGERFKMLDGPIRTRNMKGRLDWLGSQGQLTDEEMTWWDATRELRNHASHLELQMLGPPGETMRDLAGTAHAIECLFDRDKNFLSLWKGNRQEWTGGAM